MLEHGVSVEHLLSKHQALSSNRSTTKKKKKSQWLPSSQPLLGQGRGCTTDTGSLPGPNRLSFLNLSGGHRCLLHLTWIFVCVIYFLTLINSK
jgi:hypothetical protein